VDARVIWLLGGGVAMILFVRFLTPLDPIPVGPDGADWITGAIAAFWWVLGALVGLAAHRIVTGRRPPPNFN